MDSCNAFAMDVFDACMARLALTIPWSSLNDESECTVLAQAAGRRGHCDHGGSGRCGRTVVASIAALAAAAGDDQAQRREDDQGREEALPSAP